MPAWLDGDAQPRARLGQLAMADSGQIISCAESARLATGQTHDTYDGASRGECGQNRS